MDKFTQKCAKIKIIAFASVLVICFVIGLAFFARPTFSESEKRELTKFPTFTFESFLSGDYTSQVSLWFADTYPLRDPMINANAALSQLYGIKGEQLVGGGFDPTDDGSGQGFGFIYLNGGTAYQLLQVTDDNKPTSDRYVSLINSFASQVDGKANVYNMIVPLHCEIALSDATIEKYGAFSCDKAIREMYSKLSSKVTAVDVTPTLKAHNNEYLYFRTDHHWTARGAYYAYVEFCRQKGISPTALSDYQRLQFDGFLGTFYNNAALNKPSTMKNNPDYVEAFVPIGTNDADVFDSNGNKIAKYAVVYTKADKYSAGNKYLCFIGGDQPLTKIHNPNIKDGSSIVVIKESYGNAFVPFLVDSYEYVYVIDYRHWNGDLADFVAQNSIDDVLFLNVVNNTFTKARIDELDKIIN